jgi:hypothetical protein
MGHAVSLAPMRHLAIILRGHLENIFTCLTHRITNTVTED